MFNTNVVASLSKKSSQVVDVFRKALSDYEKINNEIAKEKEQTKKNVVSLQGKIYSLEELENQNNNFINKLNNLFK